MSSVITKSSKKKDQRQVVLEREYRDCIKSRRDTIGIRRHIRMHQVLYNVQLPNEKGDMHITWCILTYLVIPVLSLLLFIQSLYKLQETSLPR